MKESALRVACRAIRLAGPWVLLALPLAAQTPTPGGGPTPIPTIPVPPSLLLLVTGLGGVGAYQLRNRLRRR